MAIFIKEKYTAIRVNNKEKESYENIELQINIKNKTVHIIGIYRPPNKDKNNFITELENQIKIINKKDDLIIAGDINIDMKTRNSDKTKLANLTATYGLKQTIDKYTREEIIDGRLTQSCIDLIFIKKEKMKVDSSVIKQKISDHYITAIQINYEKIRENKQNECKKYINERKLLSILQQTDWTISSNVENAENIYEELVNKFNKVYNEATEEQKVKKWRVKKEWIDPNIINKIKERDKLFKKHKNNPTNIEYKLQYKRFRNKINKLINRAKNNHYRKKFEETKKDMRSTWKQINEILGKQKNDIDDVLKRNLETDFTPKEIVENLAMTFQQSITSIRHNCNINVLHQIQNTQKQSLLLSKPTTHDISKIIEKLDSKKPAGLDRIRVKDIKAINEKISPIITTLIKKTIDTGEIPSKLKTSIHRAIYKTGNKKDFNNYRQIANNSIIGKIMEKFVAKKLVKYLTEFKIITNRQYSYQKNKNTNKLLKEFSDLVHTKLNIQHHVLVMFIDISKCFDSLDQRKMEEALKNIGIQQAWFRNFLTNRKYTVRYKNEYSETRKTDTGTPQGSILSPYLYLIYTNDIVDYLKTEDSEIFIFADDIAITTYNKTLEQAEQIMQQVYDKMTKYSHDKKLTINYKKTKIIHIKSPHYMTRQIIIKSHETDCIHQLIPENCKCSQKIENVEQYRYLGLTIDTKFKFDIHIDNVCKRLRTCSYTLYYLGNYVDFKTKKTIYQALVESIIRYGIESWGGTSMTHIQKIEQIQKRILKSFERGKQTTQQNLFKKCDLLPASCLYEYVTIINNFFSNNFKTLIQHELTTRQITTGLLKIPTFNNEYGKQTRSYTIPSLFNKIPKEIKQLKTYGQIKRQTKDWLLKTKLCNKCRNIILTKLII